MDYLELKRNTQSPLPFWLNIGRSKSSRESTISRRLGDLAAFLAATGRLTRYESSQFIKVRPLGSGTTFRAEACKDKQTGTLVVIKSLRGLTTESVTGFDNSTLQELKVSVYPPFLRHRNIAQTLGIVRSGSGPEDGFSISLVVEYADHGSLKDLLAQIASSKSPKDFEQLKWLIVDVCAGLEILHQSRVIHGDMKPENVLIFLNDRPSVHRTYLAKLTDFGSSIVEDTTYEPFDTDHPSSIYRGTPLYVPYYVRNHSGRIPFHVMPAVDIYSLGLLLWSVLKAGFYFEQDRNRQTENAIDCWDQMSVDGIRRQFESDLREVAGTLSETERNRLLEAFKLCITDRVIDRSPITSIDRDRLYRDAFSLITKVRKTLIGNEKDNSYYDKLSSPHKPFHLGTPLSKEALDGFSWKVQCQLVQELLDRLDDPEQSEFQKGNAALQLSSYSAIGMGCKKSNDEAIRYLSIAAKLGDSAAQLLCPRVFSTHGKAMDCLDLQEISYQDSLLKSEGSITSDTDIDMEDFDEFQEQEVHDHTTSTRLPEGYSKEETYDTKEGPETGNRSDLSSDSDPDSPYVLYRLSLAFDQEFMGRDGTSMNDYFWMKIRNVEHALGFGGQALSLKYNDEWYHRGFDDPRLVEDLQSTHFSQDQLPIVELLSNDETLLKIPLLHHAAACGMLDLLQSFVQRGIPLESMNDEGETVLHISMRQGYSEMTHFLIKRGARPSVKDNAGVTPLHYLYMFGERDSIEAKHDTIQPEQVFRFDGLDVYEIGDLLKNAGADVNASMGECYTTVDVFFSHRISGTPLQAAITVGNKRAVKALLKIGADPNLRPFSKSYRPLEIAAQLHLGEIAEILLEHGASLVAESGTGLCVETWAMHSVGIHVLPLTRWLLHGASYISAAHEIIHVLLNAARKEHLDVDMRDSNGMTACQVALQEPGGDDYIVDEFLNCYANLPLDALQDAVYSCAEDEENASKVELVLSRGAALTTPSVDDDDDDGFTALHQSVKKNALQAARVILCQPKGDLLLHVRDSGGQTPLHCAASSGNEKMAKLLLENGAEINAWDLEGISALGHAIIHDHEVLTSVLLAQGADVNLHDGDHAGGTILHIAASSNPRVSKSMLTFLLSADRDEAEDEPVRFPRLHEKRVLDAVDKMHGNTALHLAAHFGNFAGVFTLVTTGVDAQIKNHIGITPFTGAKQRLQSLRSVPEPDEPLARKLEKCIRHLERAAIREHSDQRHTF